MNFAFYLSIAVAALALTFSLQNLQVVSVVFLLWTFQGSLALVLLSTLLLGMGVSLLLLLPGKARKAWQGRDQQHQLNDLEQDLKQKNQEIDALKKQLAQLKPALTAAPPPA